MTTTRVTPTGTGVPYPSPGRAGAGVLVRHDDVALRFDAGRATMPRSSEAVAFSVRTPAGVVAISGDTRACGEVPALSTGAEILVHEACRTMAMRPVIAGTPLEKIFDSHADTVALGGLAQAVGVRQLVMTHRIPPPHTDGEADAFADDVRSGGFSPELLGHDLVTPEIPAAELTPSSPRSH